MNRLPSPPTFRIAFFVAALGALVAALVPSVPFTPTFEYSDKYQHFVAFFVLAGLALFGFPQALRRLIVERLSFFGAVIEVFQSIPALHRDCDPLDWATDTAGATVAVLLLARLVAARRASGPIAVPIPER